MTMPPRRGTRLFDGATWLTPGALGVLVGGATFASFAAGRAFGGDVGQTMAFATPALSERALRRAAAVGVAARGVAGIRR